MSAVTHPGERVSFTEPGAETIAGSVRLTLVAFGAGGQSTSMAFWRQRPAAAQQYQLNAFPTLDEAWTLYLFTRLEQRGALEPQLESMCRYVEEARQGRWPDLVAPDVAIQSVYLAIAQQTLLGQKSGLQFLEASFELFEVVVSRCLAGESVTATPFLGQVPSLLKYVTALRDDERLYREDLGRAQQYSVALPAQASLTGGERTVALLVIDRPAATQFKLWARRDAGAPGGAGYALLLVTQPDGLLVLSADPSSKVRLGWVAAALSELDAHPWYDGRDHDGTLVASSREGTRLQPTDVVATLSKRALRVGSAPRARWRMPALAAASAALLVGAFFAIPRLTPAAEHQITGAKGEPLSQGQVLNLLGAVDGPKSQARYALVAGVCGYSGDHLLHSPCRDARAVRQLLIDKLGYSADDVLFFVDQPEGSEKVEGAPTAANLRLAVERFRTRFGAASSKSSFLFYYSGHGGYEKGARKDFGVLQPSGYFEHPDAPMADRGWDMQALFDDLRKGVPSQHVMVILDACYSGWAVGAKGDELMSPEVKSLWAERAEVVLTAGTKGQRAWEDEAEADAWRWGGHSAMTAFLLEGLGQSGQARADLNGDKVITDEELASFLRSSVPPAVREAKRADQLPQFFRFDENLPKSGQFLFLPAR